MAQTEDIRADPVKAAAAAPGFLFAFESDLAASQRRLPMALRFKLDACRIHLGLADWQSLGPAARKDLQFRPTSSLRDRAMFVSVLEDLLRQSRPDARLERICPEDESLWRHRRQLPDTVAAQLARICPLLHFGGPDWEKCSELERYALVKLSRPGHKNQGFCALVAELLQRPTRDSRPAP